jgi:hypothetical protein
MYEYTVYNMQYIIYINYINIFNIFNIYTTASWTQMKITQMTGKRASNPRVAFSGYFN